ncbi:DUF4124 domain-containing protein [Vreelandella alkaliphila]|uniref:DUF4124 domain-containing protein n=1 Tax=Vreelandella alkaliphila TaxID=272774 RepID=UPI0039F59AE9
MKKTALLAFLFALPVTAHAELFKCVENGHTTFQDFPCSNGNSETVDTSNITIISAPPVTFSSDSIRSVTPVRPRIYLPRPNQHQSSLERRNARVKQRARYPLRSRW